MSDVMDMTDVLPSKWKGTLAVLFFGLTVGGGAATGFYSLGPGMTLASEIARTNDNLGKLAEGIIKLTIVVDKLEQRATASEGKQEKNAEAIAQLQSDVRLQGSEAASFRASLDARVSQVDRSIEKLVEKVDRVTTKGTP